MTFISFHLPANRSMSGKKSEASVIVFRSAGRYPAGRKWFYILRESERITIFAGRTSGHGRPQSKNEKHYA